MGKSVGTGTGAAGWAAQAGSAHGAAPDAKKARHVGPPGAACSVCACSPMQQPFEAPCGHLACYACWLRQLTQHMCCAVCKRQLRKGQLAKRHFVA